MTTPRRRGASINKLIEASSLGTPQARALRRTVKPAVAASLVARSTSRAHMRAQPRKNPRT